MIDTQLSRSPFLRVGFIMIQYICDRCKREIDPDHDLRYVVQIEIEAATDAANHSPDKDHLDSLDEILENSDLFSEDPMQGATHIARRYDLCCSCYRQYCKNPLGEVSTPLGFSQN